MKTRINEHYEPFYEQLSVSDLYTRYKTAFDRLLALGDILRPFGPGESIYQPDKTFENEIKEVFTDSDDTVSIVIGYAGVGKSTSLRYVFKYRSPGAILYSRNDKILIFAAHYNGHVDSGIFSNDAAGVNAVRNDLRQRIESVCDYLEKKFPGLWKRFTSNEGQDEFYKYLETTNRQVLQHLSYDDSNSLPPWMRKKKQLEMAFEKERFTYMATKLKYYLGCKQCPCERIIIILDDIEPLTYERQRELVLQYNKFLSCMLNRDEAILEKPFIVNLIISLRPHTFRELNRDEALSVFAKHRKVFKSNNINFGSLLEKKIKYYYDEIPHENKKSFEEASDILKLLTKKFDSQYSKMIKDLTLWNIRDSVELFRNILKNRVWIQRNMDRNAAFSINEDDYVFNNITVLRSISCGSAFVYKESSDNIIPNLLQNNRGNENYFFPILATLMFFKPYDTSGYAYTNEPSRICDILKVYTEIFRGMDALKGKVDFAIDFLYQNDILLKGINDINNGSKTRLTEDTLLHLSPKGYRIAEMMKTDSVYFEVCREAVYRDYSLDGICSQSSYDLMRQGNQYKIFGDLLKLLLEILEEEEIYLLYSKNIGTTSEYNNAFGGLVSIMFLQGIDNSIRYSGHSGNRDILQMHDLVDKKIEYLNNILYQN